MTDVDLIGHYRARGLMLLTPAILMLFGLRVVFVEGVSSALYWSFMGLAWAFLLTGLVYAALLVRLYRKRRGCGDELALANRNKAVRLSFLVSLVALVPLMLFGSYLDWSAVEALVGMEAVMVTSLASIWGWIELKQSGQVTDNE